MLRCLCLHWEPNHQVTKSPKKMFGLTTNKSKYESTDRALSYMFWKLGTMIDEFEDIFDDAV